MVLRLTWISNASDWSNTESNNPIPNLHLVMCYFFIIKNLIGPKICKSLRIHRGWCIKFATGLNIINRHISKSIWVTRLLFCQNDSPMGESFWQKDILITHNYTFSRTMSIMMFSPVANLMHHPLGPDPVSKIYS